MLTILRFPTGDEVEFEREGYRYFVLPRGQTPELIPWELLPSLLRNVSEIRVVGHKEKPEEIQNG